MIALVDMDAFFAAVEQHDNPSLRGRPVGVVNGERGSTIIAASYEARPFGIRTGTQWSEARERCREIVRIVARPARYAEVSGRIMTALAEVSPEIEVFSVDEAFLDLTSCQDYYRHDPQRIACLIQKTVHKASGLSCSVGIAGDKTTAKWAARQQKPHGLVVIHPDEAEALLAPLPLTELCGIGPGIAEFFAHYGVRVCGDMRKIPISVPARRFGNLGRRLWLMAQARDPAPVETRRREQKSISHGKILPPDTRDPVVLQTFYMHLAEKMGVRLRRGGLVVRDFHIGLRAPEGWRQAWLQVEQPTDDGLAIFQLCKRFLRQHWFGEVVRQIHIHGGSPCPTGQQPDFFEPPPGRDSNRVMDEVNSQFGAFTLHRGLMHGHARTAPIISPAWAHHGTASGFLTITPGTEPKGRKKR
ncbi:MAG: DNA-directed polymerase [Moraxellaceae bacterium]|jgi:DNA polymerase-4|nr:DNA-directed polymerase [Moraxellaceae bacterium]